MLVKKYVKSKVKSQTLLLIITITYCLLPIATFSQCAMCRASLESSENTKQAQAVNDGIVFLMAIPYILVIIVSYGVYKVMKSKKAKAK